MLVEGILKVVSFVIECIIHSSVHIAPKHFSVALMMNAAQRTLEVLLLFTQVDHDFSEQKFTPSTLTSSVQNNVNDKSFYFQYLLNVLFLIG